VNKISTATPTRPRAVLLMAAAVALAWLGLCIHNAVELPHLRPLGPEYGVPTLAWLGLFGLWWALPGRRWANQLLLGWGLVSLAGAIITVLPLHFLPFKPEQSLRHYGVHVIYSVTQLPILRIVWRMLRSAGTNRPCA
jgi:hypothetical protein